MKREKQTTYPPTETALSHFVPLSNDDNAELRRPTQITQTCVDVYESSPQRAKDNVGDTFGLGLFKECTPTLRLPEFVQ